MCWTRLYLTSVPEEKLRWFKILSFELTLWSSFILFSISQFVFIVCFDASPYPRVKDEQLSKNLSVNT